MLCKKLTVCCIYKLVSLMSNAKHYLTRMHARIHPTMNFAYKLVGRSLTKSSFLDMKTGSSKLCACPYYIIHGPCEPADSFVICASVCLYAVGYTCRRWIDFLLYSYKNYDQTKPA